MIRLLFLLLTVLLMTAINCSWSNTTTLSATDIEQLKATRALLKKAMLDSDIETMKRIYSEDYELVSRQGAVRSRTERIEMLKSGKLRYLNVGEETDLTIKTYRSLAVVRGVIGPSETQFDGEKRRPGFRRFTEVWIHSNGEWLAVSRQTTTIATSAP
jgi:hypothetical protein